MIAAQQIQFADLLKTGIASSDAKPCGTIALTLWLCGLRTYILVTFKAPNMSFVEVCRISGSKSVTEYFKYWVTKPVIIMKSVINII